MNIKDKNYITIQGWMRTELDLKGNDLIVYALIYGFCQSENQKFTGSLQYIADWCGATKQGVIKNLQNLISKNLIVKEESFSQGVKIVKYYTTEFNTPIQHSCINNISNNKDIISNKLDITEPMEKIKQNNALFPNAILQPPKKQRNNLYTKCVDEIMQYTNNVVLQEKLIQYLNLRLEIARNDGKQFYANMWKGLLNDLDQLTSDTNIAIQIVEQSIRKGWRGFFELKTNKTIQSSPAERGVISDKKSDEELDLTDEEF